MNEVIGAALALIVAIVGSWIAGRSSERRKQEKKRVKSLEKSNEIYKEHSKMDDDAIRDRARSRVHK